MQKPESWEKTFRRYAGLAEFEATPIPSLDGAPILPEVAQFWRASYAGLLVLPVEIGSEISLRNASKVGQQWLDLCCIEIERKDHRVLDAYLLIISLKRIAESLFSTVQELELDPTACRKHIAWPLDGEDSELVWRRILRVTALGLPTSPEAFGMTNSPRLEGFFQVEVLDDIKELKGRAAARKHAESPDSKGAS